MSAAPKNGNGKEAWKRNSLAALLPYYPEQAKADFPTEEEMKVMGGDWQEKIIEGLATRVAQEVDGIKADLAAMKANDARQTEQLVAIQASMERHRAWHLKVEWATFSAMGAAVVWLAGSKWGWW